MKEFFDLAINFSNQMDKLNTSSLVKAAKMGDKAIKLLGLS
jgi:hypothetical protein